MFSSLSLTYPRLLALTTLLLAACSDSPRDGDEGNPCLSDNTCYGDLVCSNDTCQQGGRIADDASVVDAADGEADGGPAIDATIGDPVVGPVAALSSGLARQKGTLVQLRDGRVLVAGGLPGVTSAEIYDLDTQTISAADPLNEGRTSASATLLADGKVIIIGGYASASRLTAELFDPLDNSFRLLGETLKGPHSNHGAWMLSTGLHAGKVLIAGGAALAAPELYDPGSGTFSLLGATDAPPAAPGITVLLSDERVMYIGATSADETHQRDCYLYDPTTGNFTQVASLSTERNRYMPVALRDGRVLIAGGYNDDTTSAVLDVEIFDPSTGIMSTLVTGLSSARYLHSAARLGGSGRVALFSGVEAPGSLISTVAIFDPLTDSFSTASGSVGVARANSSALTLRDGRIFVLGGNVVAGSNTFDVANLDLVAE